MSRRISIDFLPFCQIFFIMLLGFCTLTPESVAATPECRAVVIFQQKLMQHQQVVDLLRAGFKDLPELELHILPIDRELSEIQLAQIEASDFLVAIGSRALAFALDNGEGKSGLYVLVSESELLKRALENGCWQGLTFSVPFKNQLKVIKELLPEFRHVAMVYGDGQLEQAQAFRRAADGLGFEADLSLVTKRNALTIIDRLYRRNDIFFMLPIPGLVNRLTLNKMLELQSRTRRPLVGFSANVVKLGALLSINYTLPSIADFLVAGVLDLINKRLTSDQVINVSALKDSSYTVFFNPVIAALLAVEINSTLKERVVLIDERGGR